MSEFQEFSHTNTPGAPRWVGLAVGVLGGLSLIGLGLGWGALNQAKSLEQTTVASKKANEALSQRLAKEDEINQQLQSDLRVIADKLNVTQGELISARKLTKTATHAVDQKVDSLATSMKAELISARKLTKTATHAVDQKVDSLATSMKAELATKASADDLTKLNGDVTGVKGDLDATKNSIQMARSEMGTLIARN